MTDRRAFLGGLGALGLIPAAGAQAESGDWLDRWLTAFNAPGAATYPDFVRASIPSLVPYLDEDLGVREASGGFDLLRREATGPNEVTAWLRDRNWDRFSRVVLTLGEDRIEDLSFLGASPPDGFAVTRLGEAGAIAATRAKLDREAGTGRFSGAVLIGRGDDVLMSEAWGAADATGQVAATPETRFCIGSMGKMFTAVGVLQLVQSGRLRLDDTVGDLLPDYPRGRIAETVTVEHLLTHTGGTGDFFGPVYEAQQADLVTPSDFIALFGEREPLYGAGERWGYSNFGFILLGAILERISGRAWQDRLLETVFAPAGMTATSPTVTDEDAAQPLVGAMQTGLTAKPHYVGLPAGGGYSTTGDLMRFARALRSDALLDATHRALLMTPRVPAGSRRWSLGLSTGSRNGAPYWGHGGSAPGVNADFAVYPGSGLVAVVLANRGHPHAANVADFVGARLPIVG
jgi:D-alanyl-D-alanine carboxypeptidase